METDTIERQVIENKSGFVTRLFCGDISLPITYWVFGVLIGNVAFKVIFKIIEFNYLKVISLQSGALAVTWFYWLAIAYSFFMLIAIWRSADKYQGRAIWSGLARVTVILGTLSLIGNFIVGIQQGRGAGHSLSDGIKTINKRLPIMIDNDTRLDHVSIQDKDVYYHYTLVNLLAADLDIARFISVMTPKLKTSQCENKHTRHLLNEGRKLVYMYRDKMRKPVAKIVIEKSDCL